jgi:acyl carrier protein
MTQDEIFQKVKTILTESLGADDDAVTPQARLMGDLNAESIDFLDIMFRLEREFGLAKIDKNELFPESVFQGDPKFVQNGKVTAEGLAELRTRMPYADTAAFEKDPQFDKIGDLFTVDLIVRFVQSKLKK